MHRAEQVWGISEVASIGPALVAIDFTVRDSEILDHQCRRLLRYSWLIGREAPKREKICELATLLARLCNEAFVDLLNRV